MMIVIKIAQCLKQAIELCRVSTTMGIQSYPLSEISFYTKVINCNFHKCIYNPSKL